MPPIKTATWPRRPRLVGPKPDDALGLFGDGAPNPCKSQARDLETATPPTHCETVSQ
jgi:hypothetical protein